VTENITKKRGRPPLGKRPMTPAQRQRRRRRLDKHKVKRDRRAARELALAEATVAASARLGSKRYGLIYADPPWDPEPYSRETGMSRHPSNHYPTMKLEALMAEEVPAAPDAVLFLWATIPMLPDALDRHERVGLHLQIRVLLAQGSRRPRLLVQEPHRDAAGRHQR
jgi:hypothetical protein